MIGLVVPSRGLVHSRTMEALWREAAGHDVRLYMSHDRPIPDCFNEPLSLALGHGCSYVWIVEEDVVLPHNALADMLNPITLGDADITFMDYWITSGRDVTERRGRLITTGTGCVMASAKTWRELLPFNALQAYTWPGLEPLRLYEDASALYGQHDIDFWVRAQEAGHRVAEVGRAGHCRTTGLGEPGRNAGCHEITVHR